MTIDSNDMCAMWQLLIRFRFFFGFPSYLFVGELATPRHRMAIAIVEEKLHLCSRSATIHTVFVIKLDNYFGDHNWV